MWIYETLRVTPAMEAGISGGLLTWEVFFKMEQRRENSRINDRRKERKTMAFRQIRGLPTLITEQERVLSKELGWEVKKTREVLESLSKKNIISIKAISSQSREISFAINIQDKALTADERKLYNTLRNWDH
jgi:hypothetical protein